MAPLPRLHRGVQILADHKAAEMLMVIMGGTSLALGVVLVATPDRFLTSPTFTAALRIPHWLWAIAWIIPAVWILAAGLIRRRAALIPALILAVVFTAWSIACAIPARRTIPSAVVIYSCASLVCCATAVLCTARET